MRLHVLKEQKAKTGMLGGHKGMTFQLSCRVELSPQESELVARYKAEEYPLAFKTNSMGEREAWLTAGMLTRGVNYDMESVTRLLYAEQEIKDACAGFKVLLTAMSTFGGVQVIEY